MEKSNNRSFSRNVLTLISGTALAQLISIVCMVVLQRYFYSPEDYAPFRLFFEFVAVFAGATNTPIACTVMGIELFGIEAGVFIALACSTAYLFSGHTGVYSSQIIGSPKNTSFLREKGLHLSDIKNKRQKK